jgi:hypothetical protein
MNHYLKTFLFIFVIFIIACKSEVSDTYVEKDFTSYDFPIKIKAPDSISVKKSDLGFMLDLTVKGADNYDLQIFSNEATVADKKIVIEEKKIEARNNPFFTKIIEEGDNGFIFEKKVDDTRINYDFRVVRIQGDREYTFQTSLVGKFSLDEVRRLYESVQ